MKHIFRSLLIGLLLLSCSNVDSSVLDAAKKAFTLIPDHSKVSDEAADYMTKDLYDALATAWDVPQSIQGEIGDEEFLYYFLTGNGSSGYSFVDAEITSESQTRCEVCVRYREMLGEQQDEEIESIILVMVNENGKWLLDDFNDGTKQRCLNYIKSKSQEYE